MNALYTAQEIAHKCKTTRSRVNYVINKLNIRPVINKPRCRLFDTRDVWLIKRECKLLDNRLVRLRKKREA